MIWLAVGLCAGFFLGVVVMALATHCIGTGGFTDP